MKLLADAMTTLFRSAIFKLTATYVAIVMAVCILFSSVVYHTTTQELQSGLQNQYSRWFNAYQRFGLRQPANSNTELALRSHDIFIDLFYLNLCVLAITALLSYFMAQRSLRPIERLHDQQKRFTADVSHELRTPLTAMMMEAEVSLLDKKASTTSLRKALMSSLEEAGRMKGLINSLLQLTSLETEQLQTQFTTVALRDVATSAVAAVQTVANQRHVTLETSLQARTVQGDVSSLTQLCTILLENAVKYSPDGATVSLSLAAANGRSIITIRDHGYGIAATDLPHVFDRFYRADAARSNSPHGIANNGFGLGLSLAKLIADVHHAEIIMSSQLGHGTTATIRFER